MLSRQVGMRQICAINTMSPLPPPTIRTARWQVARFESKQWHYKQIITIRQVNYWVSAVFFRLCRKTYRSWGRKKWGKKEISWETQLMIQVQMGKWFIIIWSESGYLGNYYWGPQWRKWVIRFAGLLRTAHGQLCPSFPSHPLFCPPEASHRQTHTRVSLVFDRTFGRALCLVIAWCTSHRQTRPILLFLLIFNEQLALKC